MQRLLTVDTSPFSCLRVRCFEIFHDLSSLLVCHSSSCLLAQSVGKALVSVWIG
jgi:hypothetical protein